MSNDPAMSTHRDTNVPPRRPRSLLTWLLDVIGSVRFGVVLMVLLFVYSSIGSAGAPIGPGMLRPPFLLSPDAWVSVAQMRHIEMTEMEWFHWWPFDVLIALLCLSLVTVTLRRIPFRPVNFGVWMIHSGIIVLLIGSVWYFGTKLEGDAPIARRNVVVSLPGATPVVMHARLGNKTTVRGGGVRYSVEVAGIDPQWEILDEAHAGEKAYAVTLLVTSPERTFFRQVLANYPQYTEDIVRSSDAAQPMARAKKVNADGSPLVDSRFQAWLEYDPQEHFYLMHSSALYFRRFGEEAWSARPIHGLPRYNDYVSAVDDVFLQTGDTLQPDPIELKVGPGAVTDVLGDAAFRVTGYLRYAQITERRRIGGARLDPAVSFEITDATGKRLEEQLIAFDPGANTAVEGNLVFRWFDTQAAFEAYTEVPALMVTYPESGTTVSIPVNETTSMTPGAPFVPIETGDDTRIEVRVRSVQDNIPTGDDANSPTMSVAVVEYRIDGEEFTRWVSTEAGLTRDRIGAEGRFPTDDESPFDPRVTMTFNRGASPPLITIAAGPNPDDLHLVLAVNTPIPHTIPVTPGETIELRPGVNFRVTQYGAHTQAQMKPLVVPRLQRDRGVERRASMIQVHVPGALSDEPIWLGYNEYPFESAQDALFRFPYDPTPVRMADGSVVELLFSRDRRPLPAPLALDDFVVTSRVGGFTGQTATIRNWTSRVAFQVDDTWSDLYEVSVNAPIQFGGYWYFQSSWDPPFSGNGVSSAGLNYTVLGVGNRNGVQLQLLGCCISVIGMIFAFYVKPIIKRRQRERVYRDVEARQAGDSAGAGTDRSADRAVAPVGAGLGAGMEESS
jgi:hypothetical protein